MVARMATKMPLLLPGLLCDAEFRCPIPGELGLFLDEGVAQLRLAVHQALDQLYRLLVVALALGRQRHA